MRPCTADGCEQKHWARGYCRKHYKRFRANGTPYLSTVEDRFWRQVERRGPDECWPWTGATARGYGHGHRDGEHFYAHRVSWEWANGQELDSRTVVRHLCDNPPCVNPAHLTVGTQQDNIRDMLDRGRAYWQQPGYSRKTHCKRGHAFSEHGYLIAGRTDGARGCRTCRRTAAAEGRRRGRIAAGRPAEPTPWKYPPEVVAAMRCDFDAGMRVKDVAHKYGVHPSTASRIVRGICRGSVEGRAS